MKKVGRPKKDLIVKKILVSIPIEKFNSLSDKLKYQSFSQFVNQLIDNHESRN